MHLLDKLTRLADARVQKYGAQYRSFAFFGVINYPLAYLYEVFVQHSNVGLGFRLVSTVLCVILLFKDKWPEELKKYLPLYWYTTLVISIPMMAGYMLPANNFSIEWLTNFNVSVIITILLIDTVAAFVLETIGIALGASIFYLIGGPVKYFHDPQYLSLSLYMLCCIVLFGTFFSRNKEVYAHLLLKASEDMNEKLEGMVQERTVELEKALDFKTEFLNNMSHEVRTPMQGICGVSEGMVGNWKKLSDDKKFDSVKLIEKNSKRIFSLLCNLLDLSKFEAGMMKPEFQPLNLNEALDDIIDECKTLYFNEKETRFKFTHTKNSEIIADPDRLTQVLRNIFFNAIKFSPKSSTVTARISAAKLSSEDGSTIPALEVSISDEGIGIPSQDLDVIFDNYTQSESAEKKGAGTGLGLPICKSIIELHGGKIWAENNEKKGATFHFVIPISQPGHTTKPAVEQHSNNPAAGLTILMIDDEDPCFISMEMMLMDSGCKLVRAKSGSEGVSYLKANSKDVDVVFLDLMMPDMYGYDVLQAVKENPDTAGIPVIMQSGAPEDEEIKKCFDIGLAGYIRKPYQKKDVLAALSGCIK